jgi:hypothetical protein
MAKRKQVAQPTNVVQFPRLKLAERFTDRDTIDLLEDLLVDARAGRVIGLALVSLHTRNHYNFAITGEAAQRPTFTLGAIAMLQHDTAQKINEGQQ